jgi:hypothetical protein
VHQIDETGAEINHNNQQLEGSVDARDEDMIFREHNGDFDFEQFAEVGESEFGNNVNNHFQNLFPVPPQIEDFNVEVPEEMEESNTQHFIPKRGNSIPMEPAKGINTIRCCT